MDLKDKEKEIKKNYITKIKFYSGMKTIGGTFIEVSFNNARIIFDCGSIFDPNLDEDKLKFDDIIHYELAPELEDVYDRSLVPFKNKGFNTAVFVSHAHLDHTKMINYIDESIPVYTSADTKNLIEQLNIGGKFLYNNEKNSFTTREIIGINYDETVKLGEISVKFKRVDHDAYGACGFVIKTPEIKISYTGDIRLHGLRQDDNVKFFEEAKDSDILIMEGVSVSFDSNENSTQLTEKEVIEKFIEVVNSHQKTIYFNGYCANVERMLNIISKSKKTLVFDAYFANIIKKTAGIDVYYYNPFDTKFDLNERYLIEEKEIFNLDNNYLVQISKEMVYENIKNIDSKSHYIHFDSEPIGPFDPEFEKFFKLFEQFNISYTILNCSGHAYPKDLFRIIDEIKPKLLIPIHSFKPEMLYNIYGERLLPEKNQII